MQIIISAANLLGDSLYSLKPIELFAETNDVVAIVCDMNRITRDLFHATFNSSLLFDDLELARSHFPAAVVISLSAGKAGDVAFASVKTSGKELNIAEAYAQILGVTLDVKDGPSRKWQRYDASYPREKIILLAPFSASCASHTGGKRNKTLEDWKWEHLIRFLRKQGYALRILGGPNEYMRVSVPLNHYITAESVGELERTLRSCEFLLTLDNGINHLAASMDVPTICLWPKAASVPFIAPLYAKRTCYLMMDPLQAAPMAILAGLRPFTKIMLERDYDKILPKAREDEKVPPQVLP